MAVTTTQPPGAGDGWPLEEVDAAIDRVLALHAKGLDGITRTPCIQSQRLGDMIGCELWVKLENLQYTGAFKERGALAKLLSLSDEERARGVIAASAGNHAQGVARRAGEMGISATIVMPLSTPRVKVQQTEALGAQVVLHGSSFEEANAHARHLQTENGLVFVHPFHDPYVIAGQATIAIEMLEDAPGIDTLVVPIGGGGLISGIALVAKRMRPDIEIIGVQASLYPAVHNAIKVQQSPNAGGATLAEGIAVTEPGPTNVEIISKVVDDIILVDEPALERALNLYLTTMKTLVEGAGAAGLAALLKEPERFSGRSVGTVLCGGNIDARLLSSILLRDLVRSGRMRRLRVELIDVPGQLVRVSTVIADAGGNVIDVAYHRVFSDLPAKATYIDISVEAHDDDHMNRIVDALRIAGLRVEFAAY